ncbi:MAG: ABC transporter ATP-binding protein [bacterium]
MNTLLEARGISKVYYRQHGEVVALGTCDLDLAPGESVAVIGPSGAGKSTLLNLLGGLDVPTTGTIRFKGEEIPRREGGPLATWRNEKLGFVFQFHSLLPDFTALENLLIPARMAGKLNNGATSRARELLAAMDLADREHHLPGELSGGEQQRVAVARAFMNRPEIVLADEPFGNLDREKGQLLGDLLFEFKREDGTALVIVTHDLELADRADRILRLVDGALGQAPGGQG